AELGLLFRQGRALQRLRDVRAVAFDKTGTLTLGKPAVTDLVMLPSDSGSMQTTSITEDVVLQWAASLEAHSEHPVAGAVVAHAQARGLNLLPVTHFAVVPGMGVSGRIDGRLVEIGADRYFESKGLA